MGIKTKRSIGAELEYARHISDAWLYRWHRRLCRLHRHYCALVINIITVAIVFIHQKTKFEIYVVSAQMPHNLTEEKLRNSNSKNPIQSDNVGILVFFAFIK